MAKVYVSSTFIDLKDCRARVNLALSKVGHEDVAMEYYVAGSERPVERCLADVEACDLYVGLFAWRYGYVPAKDNPDGLSITEMEYRQAQKLGKHCLIFLHSEDAPWPRRLMDKDAAQIERLRAELSTEHMTGSFNSAEDITEAVYPAVHKWSVEHGQLPRGVSIPELPYSRGRPELSLEKAKAYFWSGKAPEVRILLMNRGNVPARNIWFGGVNFIVEASFTGRLPSGELPQRDMFPNLAVNAQMTGVTYIGRPLSIKDVADLEDGNIRFFQYSKGRYEDDAGNVYQIEFCFMYMPGHDSLPLAPIEYWPKSEDNEQADSKEPN